MIDAQHFAVRFAFQPGGLVEGVGDGDQVVAVVVLVISVLARTVLKASTCVFGCSKQVISEETSEQLDGASSRIVYR
ncbi:hypothetical protein V2K55_26425 [Pseudomonas alliivorans]|uniref:hypothetical protein n=1 Tax=Pseudomonas alliivorans TaxID=2810613 RepID=UPI001AE358C4|nr:hypothetical protein [Pseudomonas alliivorans]MEE4709215.1 hypothetical protein [Pseudomonas alliivorans]MEE5041685.1 hypothetical protein [Pseudomonas alliivorans]MEE5123415.1 hypothetical protein [Pseudomonas alliivorans]